MSRMQETLNRILCEVRQVKDLDVIKANSFLRHMRDMETALMGIYADIPIDNIVLKTIPYGIVLERIKEINPFIEDYESLEEKFFQYGSLRISTKLK